MSEDKITMSKTEYETSMKLAETQASVGHILKVFEAHEAKEQQYLQDIFNKLRDMQKDVSDWPMKLAESGRELENDILSQIDRRYMSKADGRLLEEHLLNSVTSIKIWIVSSIGGFAGAGVILMWYLKMFNGG